MNFLSFCLILLMFYGNSKLYYVHFNIRHGARYHTVDFYDGAQTKPMWQQTTPVGMRQMERLGQLLRKQYIDDKQFLSDHYNCSQIEVQTSAINRTYISILSFLYGLYPLGTGPLLDKAQYGLILPPYSNNTDTEKSIFALPKGFQPIKIKRSRVVNSDCPQDNQNKFKAIKKFKEQFQSLAAKHKQFIKQVCQMFNISCQNVSMWTIKKSFQAALINQNLGRPVPPGFTSQHYYMLKLFANWYYHKFQSDQEYLLTNTIALTQIINKFEIKIRDPQSPAKSTFISSQESRLLPVSRVFNISSIECIEQLLLKGKTLAVECDLDLLQYSSSLIFELHSNNQKDFYVKIRSNGRYVKICHQLKQECSYSQFRMIIQKNIDIQNFDKYCGEPIRSQLNYQKRKHKNRRKHNFLQYL